VINGTSFSPAGTPSDAAEEDLRAHRATTIPTTVNTLAYAWRQYGSGSITWDQLLGPAIRYAEDGFPVGRFRHLVWVRHRDVLAADTVVARLYLRSDGSIPAEGEVWRQPTLGATLRRLAAEGPDDFYHGDIARRIAEDMEANGGWITLDDLAGIGDPVELPALSGSYRDFDVASLPPPGGGWVVIAMLNLLERFPPDALQPGSPERFLSLAEALRIGHRDRRDAPITDLVDYEPFVAEKLDKERAARLLETEGPVAAIQQAGTKASGETTHFSVVDADGLAVSVTASINAYFGSRAASPQLGFLYNDYMHEFVVGDPEHPFRLRGAAMPYSSMSPTIVSRDGRPVLALGSPGSARIVSAVTQVAQLWMDGHEPLAAAVGAPRAHVVPDENLYLEARPANAPLAALREAGFTLTAPASDLAIANRNAYFGGVHAVAFEDGMWVGAADPRRDGAVRVVPH
jgi:gamma-glutamyltranspeptidase/glutathione hydrolase